MLKKEILLIPNLLSLSRIVFLPVLFAFAFLDYRWAFLIAYCIIGSTDMIDGWLARKLDQVTELGKKLDSIGDLAFYLSTAIFAWWLFPEYIKPNLALLYLLLMTIAASFIISAIKTGKPRMLHTMSLKTGACTAGATLVLAFFTDATYLVTLAITIYFAAFIEEIIIFIRYGNVDPDVKSLFHIKKRHKRK